MTVFKDSMICIDGKPVAYKISKSFEYFDPHNFVWVNRVWKDMSDLMAWIDAQTDGDIYLHNYEPKILKEPFTVHRPDMFIVEFTSPALLATFVDKFGEYITEFVQELLFPEADTVEKPDEPHPTLGTDCYLRFPKGETPRTYYRTSDLHWFADSPYSIVRDHLGFNIERGKVNNLVSFGDGELDLWYYLALLPIELRATPVADEWINFILGPLAAALKVKGLWFADREKVIASGGLLMMFEAMAMDLVPPGKRKNLYEALLERFNTEFNEFLEPGEHEARVVFYGILADVVEPIFAEASGDELVSMIRKVLEANPKQAAEAKDDPKVVGWLMGQVMRSSPTKLDPNTVRAAILTCV